MITKKDLELNFHKETGMVKKADRNIKDCCKLHPKEYYSWIEDKLIELLNKEKS
jgi:hypothetical protein